jgi:predicted O-linked N-acetylglucosamine transferase (SPINDLY family)
LRKLDVDTDAKYLPTRRRGAGSVTRLGLIMSRVPRTPECLNALALWQQLDPDRFVPFLFVDGAAEDDLRPLFAPRGVVVALVPIIREQVPLIRNYHLDVVVFGSPVMPTAEFPTPLAAHRLAPWQVALDGTCGLTGLAAVDRWILGRAVAVDPDPATTLLIPGSGRCYDYTHLTAQSAATEPLTRAMAHLPADAVVFASGAHLRKMTPEMLLVWAEILAQVPGSFLLLAPLGPHLPGTWAVEPMLEAIGQNFTARGVDPGRVVVVVRPVATARQASERWRIADIWLDTWPWSSFFSAADAIAAGVPVVAWEGTLPRSRRSAAILRDLGLPELIAGTRSAYVDLAARLGRDAAFRHQITARVRAAWAAVPAYADTGAYGCHLRDAILELVEHERR